MAAAAGHIVRKYMSNQINSKSFRTRANKTAFFSLAAASLAVTVRKQGSASERSSSFQPLRRRERKVLRTGGGETVAVDLYVDVATDTTHGHGFTLVLPVRKKKERKIRGAL